MDRDTSLVKPFVEKYGLTFTNLLDPAGKVHPMLDRKSVV